MGNGPEWGPRKISHYALLEQIGAGGMGVVFRAHDERLDRDVALKVISSGLEADSDARKRFRTEAAVLTRLNHPNIATVFDFGTEGGTDFLVLELVQGASLDELLRRRRLHDDELLDLAIQMMKGIAAAHEQKILHRDLKPSNIRVRPDGHLKILDFGLAKVNVPVADESKTLSGEATKVGTLLGTLPYMSPEQLRGEAVDERSDVYSAAVVLYQMATGRLPFDGSGAELTDAILNRKPSVPSALRPALDARLDTIILKGLEKKPSLRYQSARELLVDLERLRTAAVGTVAEPRRTGKVWLTLALAAMLVAIAAGGIYFFKTSQKAAPATAAATELKSVAILPLKPIGTEAGNDFLGSGLADSIINKLSRTQMLIVRPFSTVRKYATSETDSLSAARELGVDSVLDGTVQKSGTKLRISVNLLRTSDGSSLWSDILDFQSDDIFKIQEQVSTQVVERLRGSLEGSARDAIAKRYTSNPEAYANFVKGSYYSNQVDAGPDSGPLLDKVIGYFQAAIKLDPNYALARAQLAYAYAWYGLFTDPKPEWIDKARAELAVAEKLDPNLAEIHEVKYQLAWSSYEHFDLLKAGLELRKAQAIDPGSTSGEAAVYYAHLGMRDLAVDSLARAEKYAPQESLTTRIEANGLLGNYEEAVRTCALTNAGAPCPAASLVRLGRTEDALRATENQLKETPNHPQLIATKAVVLLAMGRKAEADALVTRMVASARTNRGYHHVAFDAACVYASTRSKDEAIAMLREAAATGMPNVVAFRNDPFLKPLQGYPAYERMMEALQKEVASYEQSYTATGSQ